MDDRSTLKIYYSHIFRISAIALVVIIGSLNEAYATTGIGDGEKTKSKTEAEKKDKNTVKSDKVTPIRDMDNTTTAKESVVVPYYEPPYLDKDITASGEDQNAVLSFNIIQYIFQRFKFSDEIY